MIELEMSFPEDAAKALAADTDRYRAILTANIALQITNFLRRKSANLWPQHTGFSRDSFFAEDESNTGHILIKNSAPYAAAVNNRERYPRGGTNPNYRAVQRTVEKYWNTIVTRAAKALN